MAASLVNCMDEWQSFNVERKAVAAGTFVFMAKLSSTHLLKNSGNLFSRSSFSSIEHKKALTMRGPRGEPIATPSTCPQLLRELSVELKQLIFGRYFQNVNQVRLADI